MAEKDLLLQPQDRNFVHGKPELSDFSVATQTTPGKKVNLNFSVGPPIPDQELALIEWNNLNYFIQQKPPNSADNQEGRISAQDEQTFLNAQISDNLAAENRKKGLPQATYVTREDSKSYRQILFNSTGFVKPREMVAIIGPSGSGKTSLLNALSQRTQLSKGSQVDGTIMINQRKLSRGDYGKVGAFVQQDDVLQATYTVKELFEFAANIRTNMDREQLTQTVEDTIKMMGLTACADSLIGGWLRRGISGGERKRTSIGYEMITKPSLLLLDEPTSGLDSSTAVRIMQLMRQQAERGMAVLATIHQPSSELFQLFDRVIVLSEGHTVYNGPPMGVKGYFSQFGLQMRAYSNPADKLSIIASMPRRQLKPDITIERLAAESMRQQSEYHTIPQEERQSWERRLNTRFSIIAQEREVSFGLQWWLLYKRFMVYTWRNPISIVFLIFLAFFQSFLQACIFWKLGSDKFTPDRQHDVEVVTNLVGLSFLVAQDQFVNMVFGQILQIPQYNPIFKREFSNHMYSVHSYYCAVICQTLTCVWFYPVLVTLFTFYTFDFEYSSAGDMFHYMASLVCTALCGAFFGISIGTMTSDENVAILIGNFAITLMNFGAGCLANTGDDPNPIIAFLTWVSPMHYSVELIFQQVTKGRFQQERLLERFGYTDSDGLAFGYLIGFTVFWIVFGWFILWFKNRNY